MVRSASPPPRYVHPIAGAATDFERRAGESRFQTPAFSPQTKRLVTSVALALITAVGAYWCLTHGFNRLDMAYSRLDVFAGGSMVYMGLCFSCVAVANTVYGIWKTCMQEDREYTSTHMKQQVGASVLAPIVAIPAVLFMGAGAALNAR